MFIVCSSISVMSGNMYIEKRKTHMVIIIIIIIAAIAAVAIIAIIVIGSSSGASAQEGPKKAIRSFPPGAAPLPSR
jgi:flagellar basal body-associated protein FliL